MNRGRHFLTLGLGISSGTLLFDRFIVPLPNWIAIGLALAAAVCLITSMTKKDDRVIK